MRFFAVAFIFIGAASFAQTPQVPHKILFAGMTLTIHEDAKHEIQKDVDALTRSARYFNMKAERARTYFPIIEKIFKEENLPEDFKYLCLQESSLVPDAVSVSNAVGFWQFKDFTAQEMGLRVDGQIDERMNIVSSSRAAAKYIKQNNWYFNNWVLALQAYQMGKGGVIEAVGDKHNGEMHMVINAHTYWYVKKFLAHKIAFENAVSDAPQVKVSLYETKDKKNLSDIASEVSIDENVLKEYNKWAKLGVIPNDKTYSISIPNGNMPKDFDVLVMNQPKSAETKTTETSIVTANNSAALKEKIEVEMKFHINGVPVIKALPNENVSSISKRMGIDASKFIDFNDIAIDARIIADNYYFIKPKKKKGAVSVYQTQAGDNLWSISQQQGVRLSKLKKINPNIDDRSLASGVVVRLNNKTVEENPSSANIDEVAELGDESFAWGSQPLTENGKLSTSTTVSPNLSDEQKTNNNPTTVSSVDTLQVIKPNLPRASKDSTDTIIMYEVKPSDTLYGIARQFDATIKDIMEWNNKSSFSISVGEKLKIKKR